FSTDSSDLDQVLTTLAAHTDAVAPNEAQTQRFVDRGAWLLLLLVPIAAMAFRRGWAMLLVISLAAAHSPRAQAVSWTDLGQRSDQQAREQLDAGKAAQAEELAVDPALRGVAAYRNGDYAAAADALVGGEADVSYNRGNALAKQGRFDEAIAAYD